MKKVIKLPLYFFFLFLSWTTMSFSSKPIDNSFIGEWKTTFADGGIYRITFNFDGTYTSIVNTMDITHQSSGKYKLEKNKLSILSNSRCTTIWGTYKVTFETDTSFRITLMEDKCEDRANKNDGILFLRVNNDE